MQLGRIGLIIVASGFGIYVCYTLLAEAYAFYQNPYGTFSSVMEHVRPAWLWTKGIADRWAGARQGVFQEGETVLLLFKDIGRLFAILFLLSAMLHSNMFSESANQAGDRKAFSWAMLSISQGVIGIGLWIICSI